MSPLKTTERPRDGGKGCTPTHDLSKGFTKRLWMRRCARTIDIFVWSRPNLFWKSARVRSTSNHLLNSGLSVWRWNIDEKIGRRVALHTLHSWIRTIVYPDSLHVLDRGPVRVEFGIISEPWTISIQQRGICQPFKELGLLRLRFPPFPRISGFQIVDIPSWIQEFIGSNANDQDCNATENRKAEVNAIFRGNLLSRKYARVLRKPGTASVVSSFFLSNRTSWRLRFWNAHLTLICCPSSFFLFWSWPRTPDTSERCDLWARRFAEKSSST